MTRSADLAVLLLVRARDTAGIVGPLVLAGIGVLLLTEEAVS
jgi:hypothetical protein